jgi:hypothetical protein
MKPALSAPDRRPVTAAGTTARCGHASAASTWRALAIIGMVMVHIGPDDAGRPGLLAQTYRWSHGRASIQAVNSARPK